MNSRQVYPSKILLTGEYTVLLGFPAMAIPYNRRYASWVESADETDTAIKQFYDFCLGHPELKNEFHFKDWKTFSDQGGMLQSTIPYGYGLGSSGSFCAAILDRFGKIKTDDIYLVHHVLKTMESCFHGKSSGLDPLVIYYEKVLQFSNNELFFPDINPENLLSRFTIQLVDSKHPRNTQAMVKIFTSLIADSNYHFVLQNEVATLNNLLIQNILDNHKPEFDKNWNKLSQLSLTIFTKMIPGPVRSFWQEGIHTGAYYTKLCGAGGGGLFLVNVQNENLFLEKIQEHGLQLFQ